MREFDEAGSGEKTHDRRDDPQGTKAFRFKTPLGRKETIKQFRRELIKAMTAAAVRLCGYQDDPSVSDQGCIGSQHLRHIKHVLDCSKIDNAVELLRQIR